MSECLIRLMQPEDLPGVFALQCSVYPDVYHEPVEALSSRLVAGNGFCFIAWFCGELAGYVFAHPWQGSPPVLHAPLPETDSADHVFLHDLAVSRKCRGMALGARLHSVVRECAARKGLDSMRLVAVGQAKDFWLRMGFSPRMEHPVPLAYGEAVLMESGFRGDYR